MINDSGSGMPGTGSGAWMSVARYMVYWLITAYTTLSVWYISYRGDRLEKAFLIPVSVQRRLLVASLLVE